jgi:hypothetical protein
VTEKKNTLSRDEKTRVDEPDIDRWQNTLSREKKVGESEQGKQG